MRGRTSVVPAGHASPCLIWTSPEDCPGGRPALDGGCALPLAEMAAATIIVMVTNLVDKKFSYRAAVMKIMQYFHHS